MVQGESCNNGADVQPRLAFGLVRTPEPNAGEVTIGSSEGAFQALHERDPPAQDLTHRGIDPMLDGVKLNAMIGPQV